MIGDRPTTSGSIGDPTGDIRQKSLRSGAVVLATESARAVLVVGYLAVIARLLTPADFGVIAMSTAVLWVIAPLATMGLGQAAVQTAELDGGKLNAVFWWSLFFGICLTTVAFLCASWVGRLYGLEEVADVTRVLTLVFLINGLGAVPFAVLQRELRFGVLSGLEVVALLFSAVVAIVAAMRGLGYWALVLHELALHSAMIGGAWLFCGWRPGAPTAAGPVRPLLDYGRPLTAFRLLQSLRVQFDRFLVGRTASPSALGAYASASNLLLRIMHRIMGPVSRVAVSSLSRFQDQVEEFREHYRLSVLWTMTLSLPVVVFVALESEVVVLGLLGPQWTEAIPIFEILAIGAVAVLLRPATNWVLQAIGRTDRQLRWGLIEVVAYLVAFLLAARWGVLGIATANVVVAYLTLLPRAVYSFRHSPVGVGDLWGGFWRPGTAALLAAGVWTASSVPLPEGRPVVQLIAGSGVFMMIYSVFWLLLPGGRAEFLETWHTVFKRSPSS